MLHPCFPSLPGTARQPGLAPASRCTLLTMDAPYISNIVPCPWEEFITTFGPAKDNALPLMGGIKVAYSSVRQTEGCLVAKMWIPVYGLRLPGLITMKCPSMASQAMPQRSNPLYVLGFWLDKMGAAVDNLCLDPIKARLFQL
ncbi:hypothetical protein GUJ93_ZPchr0012g20880 [Zizania palustris]|uniref:Uncharacterized protein n=1 Tax=Zizania palustris TaxID=103762 RepID=A0A8J5WN29_ZIZPA|nr:hypothetical protein GUJ93_ZPchr0012g20880 [Zizania palustris]